MNELEKFLKHEDWCASQKFWRAEPVCDCGCSEAQQEYDGLRSLLSDALKALEPFVRNNKTWPSHVTYTEIGVNPSALRAAAELHARIKEVVNSQ